MEFARPGSPATGLNCQPDNFDPVANILYRNNGDRHVDVSSVAVAASRGKGLRRQRSRTTTVTDSSTNVRGKRFGAFVPLPQQGQRHFRGGSDWWPASGLTERRQNVRGHGDGVQRLRQRRSSRCLRDRPVERTLSAFSFTLATPSFRDVSNATGIGGITLPFSGWSTRLFDYDNDGWKDIFVAQGRHVMDTIEKTAPQLEVSAAAAAAAQRRRPVHES